MVAFVEGLDRRPPEVDPEVDQLMINMKVVIKVLLISKVGNS
jgi:hypothetical protein